MWGWIGHNPAKLATAPSVQKADVQPPRTEEAARLLVDSFTTAASLVILWRYLRGVGWREPSYAWTWSAAPPLCRSP